MGRRFVYALELALLIATVLTMLQRIWRAPADAGPAAI
jgi:hypothetical protein